MITQAIFNVIFSIIDLLLGWLPDITSLPTILGINLDTVLLNGMGYVRRLIDVFPPLGSILIASTIYLSFKVTMLLLKIALGSRVPHHSQPQA